MKKYSLSILLSCLSWMLISCTDGDVSPLSKVDGGTGQGGSMARFAISGDYLYIVDHTSLHVNALQDPRNPVKTNVVSLG